MCKAIQNGWEVVSSVTSFKFKADNRQRVEFWKDRWCGNSSLDESFPKLLSIASAKDTWLVEIWEQEGEGGCSNHTSQDISMTKSSSK